LSNGVATTNLYKGLVPEEKSVRVARFQKRNGKVAMDLIVSGVLEIQMMLIERWLVRE
jgi:hypothetical protein